MEDDEVMIRPSRCAPLLVILLSVVIPLSAENASPLEGLWYGQAIHDGTTGHIALRVKTDEEGLVIGMVSLLDIDVRDLPFGIVRQDGRDVTVGAMKLVFDEGGETLSGALPDSLVPVYSIPFTLRRSTELPPAEKASSEASEVVPRWTFDAGAPVWGGLAARDGQLAFGSDDGTIFLLDGATGEERWRFATQGKIRSRPLFDDDDLLVASDDGFVYRLSLGSGELRWKARAGDALNRPVPGEESYQYDNYASSPVIQGEALYVGTGEALVALDAKSGKELWRHATSGAISTTPALTDDQVFVGSFDGKLYAMRKTDGAEIWSHSFGAPVTSSPALADRHVIAGSRSYDLTAFDAATGREAWSHYEWFSWIESSPTVADGIVYVGSSDAQKLRAFDASSGAVGWTFDTGGSAWAQPAVSDERVYVGSVGVAGYLVDHRATFWAVDRNAGRAVWRFDLPQPEGNSMWGFASSPVVDGASVYAATLDGKVLAFATD